MSLCYISSLFGKDGRKWQFLETSFEFADRYGFEQIRWWLLKILGLIWLNPGQFEASWVFLSEFGCTFFGHVCFSFYKSISFSEDGWFSFSFGHFVKIFSVCSYAPLELHEVSNVIQYSGSDVCDICTASRISDDYNISVGSGRWCNRKKFHLWGRFVNICVVDLLTA